jgi:NAD-dependent SIR2 family protein deacetylase
LFRQLKLTPSTKRFHQLLKKDLNQADLLLIMGASLQVAPASQIPNMASCPRVLFNRDLMLQMNEKDVFVKGDRNTNVELLCKNLFLLRTLI